jgi:DNA-binding PadR family transcriptional regulator
MLQKGLMENKGNTPRDLFPEMMILESLRRQPAHGYALVQNIQQRSNNLL